MTKRKRRNRPCTGGAVTVTATLSEIAAGCGQDPADAARHLAHLARHGWVRQTGPDRWSLHIGTDCPGPSCPDWREDDWPEGSQP